MIEINNSISQALPSSGKSVNSKPEYKVDQASFVSEVGSDLNLSRDLAVTTHNGGNFQNVQKTKDELSQVAQGIRNADETMQKIDEQVGKMHDGLDEMVKRYPPYLQGSEERNEKFKNYKSLQKLIDQLTVPPNKKGSLPILADQGVVPEAGDQIIQIGENNSEITIKGQPAHSGPDGLNIPKLDEESNDDEVYAALAKLGEARETLNTKRANLSDNASEIFARSGDESFSSSSITEEEAITLSQELKSSIRKNGTSGISSNALNELTNLK